MTPEPVPYEGLHAVLVNAIRLVPSGQSTEQAAHEALTRLRETGLPIPPRPPDDPFGDDPAVLLGELGQAITATDTELHSQAFVDLPHEKDLIVVLRIGDELVVVKQHEPRSPSAVVARGVSPTAAIPHAADELVYLT